MENKILKPEQNTHSEQPKTDGSGVKTSKTYADVVSRQAAIDVLSLGKEILSRVLDDMDVVGTDRDKYSWGIGLIESNINDIEELPSAQPYTEAEIQKMQNLEQAQLDKAYELGKKDAQPTIIRCKDCKYSDENWRRVSVKWLPCMDIRVPSNWFCGSAERREDE